jgi:hypothetical protein
VGGSGCHVLKGAKKVICLTRGAYRKYAPRVPALPETHIDICASSKSTTEAQLGPPKIPEAHINKMRLK